MNYTPKQINRIILEAWADAQGYSDFHELREIAPEMADELAQKVYDTPLGKKRAMVLKLEKQSNI